MIPSHLQSECVELLAKYEIVLNLGESHYFIPSLLPSNLQHSSVLGDGPVNKYSLSYNVKMMIQVMVTLIVMMTEVVSMVIMIEVVSMVMMTKIMLIMMVMMMMMMMMKIIMSI